MSVPTVADLRPHVNLSPSDTSQDDELQDHLDAAVEIAEGIVGPLSATTVTETHYGLASDTLVLRQVPVASVTAVSSWTYGVTTPLTVTDYVVDTDSGILRTANGLRFYGGYTVTYAVGRSTLPASVHLGILVIAAHLWETQRMPMQGPDSGPVGFGGGIDAAMPTSRGFALPNRALELLRPYAAQPVTLA